ncbi:MAG: DUF1465 family protein [Pseudomonadota bacterium]
MVQAEKSNTISLSKHRATSHAFQRLYAEGMQLVEETATYLDGEGRIRAKSLSRECSTLYAAESMRLTTRLMQVASWLLLQRALNNGEMSREQVVAEKAKVRFDSKTTNMESGSWHGLPDEFGELVRRSLRLQEQIKQMDQELFGANENIVDMQPAHNPVGSQIHLLKTAFGS